MTTETSTTHRGRFVTLPEVIEFVLRYEPIVPVYRFEVVILRDQRGADDPNLYSVSVRIVEEET